jgi:3-oxoacyl-[acyl-carrier-protein] synthase I
VIYFGAAGLVCPVGLSAKAACAAMRAGVAKFDDLPYGDKNGQAIVGASVPGLDFTLKRGQRLVELLALAIADSLAECTGLRLDKVPLLVGLAEPGRPAGGAQMVKTIVPQVQEKLGLKFHPGLSRAIPEGRAAGFEVLRVAREILSHDPEVPGCLVCGVDSYINASSLLWLEHQWRLKREDHSNGVIPGEAAAAVLVHRHPDPVSGSQVSLAGLGFGNERATVLSEEPLLGLGLTEAARAALHEAGIQMHEIAFRISDVTGESYGFKEQALVIGRLLRVHREEGYPIWHCAENIGDTGAAAGVVGLVTALYAFRKGYAPGRIALCFASSDWGKRAVAVLACNSVKTPGT